MSRDAACLEEGEIADSCESDNEAADRGELFSGNPERSFQPIESAASYRSSCRTHYNTSSESSSDEERELNTSPMKAKRVRPNAHSAYNGNTVMDHNHGFLEASHQFRLKQNQNVWNKVALEQTIDASIRKVNTVEDDSDDECQDRGVESYNFKCKGEVEQSQVRSSVDYGDDVFSENDEEKDETDSLELEDTESGTANICVIESFGVDADSELNSQRHSIHLSRKRTMKERISPKIVVDDVKSHSRRSVKDRLGPRKINRTHKFTRKATFNFECTENDPPETVAKALVKALGEPMYQTELFERVVNNIGVKKSIELLYVTENIEENGGMLVQRGDRRRSPGGVYLQMVKNDGATTKAMIKVMFPFQKIKRKHRMQRKKGAASAAGTAGMVKELPSKAEVLLAHLEADKVAMDTGQSDDELSLDPAGTTLELDLPQD